MQELFRDTWVYQEILREGREAGLKAGLKEGLKEGREEGIKEGQELEHQIALAKLGMILVTFVREHYPELESTARDKVQAVADLETLQNVLTRVVIAKTYEQVADSLA